MKALVVSGSLTSENKYGVVSARRVAAALRRCGQQVEVIHARHGKQLLRALLAKPDVVVPVGFGAPAEDGQVRAAARLARVPCAGPTPGTGGVMMNKHLLSLIARGLFADWPEVHVPNEAIYRPGDPPTQLLAELRCLQPPFVLKPTFGGSSEGLAVVASARDAAETVRNADPTCGPITVQEYIRDVRTEISSTVLHTKGGVIVLPLVGIDKGDAAVFGVEEKFGNASIGRHVLPAALSPCEDQLVRKVVLELHSAIGAVGLTRTDLLVTDSGALFILEMNGIPGLLDSSIACDAALAAGISFDELCLLYQQTAFLTQPEPLLWA